MNKSLNIIINETRAKILQDITESKLPAAIIQLMINEIKQNIDIQTQQIIQFEMQQSIAQELNTDNANKEE